ncbi:hypothetical protein P12x_000820 [Tundrisphaera lichenicola]|uniref:hypothetical protein n=1 Tax=Tundrisphaera lichenicola TaxID=2029860 RepID=UPI003EB80D33
MGDLGMEDPMRTILALLIITFTSGCAMTHDVRYVYQDGDFGVIGLPENTDEWPTHYRSRAEELMEKHFPQGHEIVRAEEVIEGERMVKSEGTHTAEVSPQLPAALVNVAKLGRSEHHSQSDTLKLKECRIIYRRSDLLANPKGFAKASDLTPTQYLDPNALERKKFESTDSREPEASEKPKAKKSGEG